MIPDIFIFIPRRTSSLWLDGKEAKVILRQTGKETTAMMQLMTNNVCGIKSLSSSTLNPSNIVCLNIPTVTQWRQDLRKWLSSPDPSTNHVILCCAQHQGTTQWFFRGSFFEAWKTAGSLLWVHGKRTSFNPSPSRSTF